MKTRVTELLGIEAPIIQGGMARVADASLAAGGQRGRRPGHHRLRRRQARLDCRAGQAGQGADDKPFGCNIMLMDPLTPEIAKLVVELDVKVVTTGAGSPTEYLPMWREAGIKVIPVIATTAQARRMERLGVDAPWSPRAPSPAVTSASSPPWRSCPACARPFPFPSSPLAVSPTVAASARPSRWVPRACRWVRASSLSMSAPCATRGRRRCLAPRTPTRS